MRPFSVVIRKAYELYYVLVPRFVTGPCRAYKVGNRVYLTQVVPGSYVVLKPNDYLADVSYLNLFGHVWFPKINSVHQYTPKP